MIACFALDKNCKRMDWKQNSKSSRDVVAYHYERQVITPPHPPTIVNKYTLKPKLNRFINTNSQLNSKQPSLRINFGSCGHVIFKFILNSWSSLGGDSRSLLIRAQISLITLVENQQNQFHQFVK